VIDEVVATIFKAPRSYTRENIVEISCHGSTYIVQQILQVCMLSGARAAKAGEFTLRAFLNGALDLSQAEAVADLIHSESEASHQLAIQQMRGGFSNEIKRLRDELIHLASLLELELDFAEEDVEFANRDQLTALLQRIRDYVNVLMDSFQLGNVIKSGVTTVIAGRPNAGKSTLLNALLNEERAIVSDIPGTTRDTIEESLNINGILFKLIDTAGIREAADEIEKIGVQKTMQKIQQSAILIYLFDVNEMSEQDVITDIKLLPKLDMPLLLVANKCEGKNPDELKVTYNHLTDILFISAKAKQHLQDLKHVLVDQVLQGPNKLPDVVVSNARHYDALLRTQQAIDDAQTGIDMQHSKELIALDLRHALDALGEIAGTIYHDELLDNIFSKFCIGK
jgi:tRNA modification GTPase